MGVGRPTLYSEEMLDIAREYLNGGWEKEGDVTPQVIGLAMAMNVHRDTLYDWAKQEDKKDFSDIFTRVHQAQERKLINGGLSGEFNPAVTKMLLVKHGYSDKLEQEVSGKGGGAIEHSVITFVGVNANSD